MQAVRGGRVTPVPPHELVLGDIVVLNAGCQVPADAELCTGAAEVNEALLTGEADNVRKRPGTRCFRAAFSRPGSAAQGLPPWAGTAGPPGFRRRQSAIKSSARPLCPRWTAG